MGERFEYARLVGVVTVVSLALSLLFAPGAGAAKNTIHVRATKGPGALQAAINRASSGMTLRLHKGRYREAVVVDKPLRIIRNRKGKKRRPVVDARCNAPTTISVTSNGVRLRGLKVVGASEAFEVDYREVSSGQTKRLWVKDTCNAEYGINVGHTTGPLKFIGTRAEGFHDAGIYVGDVTDTGSGELLVARTNAYRNQIGVLIEYSAGGDIRVAHNRTHDNNVHAWVEPTGIYIYGSSGVVVHDNVSRDNGAFGILVGDNEFPSFNNVFYDNVSTGNPQNYAVDPGGGSGNCGSGNSFSIPPC